jgi:hypothetical protein
MSKRNKSHLVRLNSKVWYLSHENEIYLDWYQDIAPRFISIGWDKSCQTRLISLGKINPERLRFISYKWD